jgi:hypothetical protein
VVVASTWVVVDISIGRNNSIYKIKGEGGAYLAVVVAGKGGGEGGYATRVGKVEVGVEPSSCEGSGGYATRICGKNFLKEEGRGRTSLVAVVLIAARI